MAEDIREVIRRELPALVTRDPEIRDWVWRLIHEYAPSRAETESRFDKMLAEIRAMREESERRWEENQRKWEENQRQLQAMREESERRWEENQRKWEENQRKWEENQRKWEENQRKWEENQRKWEENQRKWEENQRKWEENQRQLQAMREESERRWEENQRVIRELLEQIRRVDRRIDRTIGALGARWGISTEASFRNALRAILEESFGVKVERVEEWDESGEVFDRPDQVELDVIIHNGQMLVCEIKSAASRSDIYTFERKVRWYERRTQRKADRKLLISPIVLEKDKELAQELGIEVYSDAEEVVS
ncbi:MAG: DUF3782 domain-containing protein [Anaerolineales bacterium]|nr:DUF3782 domain-containing protein [Anaerolineales bacterium]MDW8446480.1 DUF3782 domain-containing protein [Anaerolineales bacterium]